MREASVHAPASLLLHCSLAPSAKLVWLVTQLSREAGTTLTTLAQHSGLSRETVKKGLAQLSAAGWHAETGSAGLRAGEQAAVRAGDRAEAQAGTTGRRDGQSPDQARPEAPSPVEALIPTDLLADPRVGTQAKLLFGYLQLTPGFSYPRGSFAFIGLTTWAGASRNTVKGAVSELVQAGWLQTSQLNQLSPIHFTLRSPHRTRAEAEAARVRHRLQTAPYHGEALMREYLSLLVDSANFEDNAAPGFLDNPFTDGRLELDRFYPPDIAFEYNGPQHYGPSGRFTAAESAKQRGRDLIKLGLCVTRGIRLVVVHPEDLSLEGMRSKIGGLLPLRDLTGHQPAVDLLERVSRGYRRAAKGPGG